jgi:hypothetical protein
MDWFAIVDACMPGAFLWLVCFDYVRYYTIYSSIHFAGQSFSTHLSDLVIDLVV